MDIYTTVIFAHGKLQRAIVRTHNRDEAAKLFGIPLKDTKRSIGHAADILEIEALLEHTHEVYIRPHLDETAPWEKLVRTPD